MKLNNLIMYSFIGAGSGRVALKINEEEVIKIPLSEYGIDCNKEEYNNFINLSKENKNYVGNIIKFKDNIITMEFLTDLHTLKYKSTLEEIKEQLKDTNISNENIDKLFELSLGNRLQIGKSKSGHYKIYDFETAKLKSTFGERRLYSNNVELTKISWKNYLEDLQIHKLSWDELYYCDWANGEKKWSSL